MAALVAAFWAISFFPTFDAPAFRYTGSNVVRPVWNFGWPFPQTIYDPQTGLQQGAFAIVIPMEIAVLTLVKVVLVLQRRVRRN